MKILPSETFQLPYSRLISRGANFRVFHESGPIRKNFFPRKFLCLWKVTRKRDRVSFLALCRCKAKFYMSLHRFVTSSWECVLQYHSSAFSDCHCKRIFCVSTFQCTLSNCCYQNSAICVVASNAAFCFKLEVSNSIGNIRTFVPL